MHPACFLGDVAGRVEPLVVDWHHSGGARFGRVDSAHRDLDHLGPLLLNAFGGRLDVYGEEAAPSLLFSALLLINNFYFRFDGLLSDLAPFCPIILLQTLVAVHVLDVEVVPQRLLLPEALAAERAEDHQHAAHSLMPIAIPLAVELLPAGTH